MTQFSDKLAFNKSTEEDFAQMKNAIEVQLIDTDLYMRKELYMPVGARGVFGGQVHTNSLNIFIDTCIGDCPIVTSGLGYGS
jgi:hypothetical protein